MSQTRLYLLAPKADAEALFAAFEREFEEDGAPLALVEIDEAAGICEISVYTDQPERDLRRMQEQAGKGGEIRRESLPEIDWVAKSVEGLQPVRAGAFLVQGSHDRGDVPPGAIAIPIAAGQALGTGQRGTTAGCLELIDQIVRQERPAVALDLGTGSAVRAIAIARLAA